MTKDDPIIIRKVANGFFVEPLTRFDHLPALSDTFVFANIADLQSWLESHYTRAGERAEPTPQAEEAHT